MNYSFGSFGFLLIFNIFTLVPCALIELFPNLSIADVNYLPRSKEALSPDTVSDEMVYVPHSIVAYFNRYALERDFPFLRGKEDQAIINWILDNCAYISKSQLLLNEVRQSKIEVSDGKTKIGFRPPGWHRSAVVPVENGTESVGLIDIKGAGLTTSLTEPNHLISEQIIFNEDALKEKDENKQSMLMNQLRTRDHSDGLATLGEAIAEVSKTEAMQNCFNNYNINHNTSYQTVETYFIISLPFKILKDGKNTDPPALIGRQAHLGRTYHNAVGIPDTLCIDPPGGKQGDQFGAFVDMGGVFPTCLEEIMNNFLTADQKQAYNKYIENLGQNNATSSISYNSELRKLFDPQHSLEWKRAHDLANFYLNHHNKKEGLQKVREHVNAVAGPYLHLNPSHDRLQFNYANLNAYYSLSSNEVSELIQFEKELTKKPFNEMFFNHFNILRYSPQLKAAILEVLGQEAPNNMMAKQNVNKLIQSARTSPETQLTLIHALRYYNDISKSMVGKLLINDINLQLINDPKAHYALIEALLSGHGSKFIADLLIKINKSKALSPDIISIMANKLLQADGLQEVSEEVKKNITDILTTIHPLSDDIKLALINSLKDYRTATYAEKILTNVNPDSINNQTISSKLIELLEVDDYRVHRLPGELLKNINLAKINDKTLYIKLINALRSKSSYYANAAFNVLKTANPNLLKDEDIQGKLINLIGNSIPQHIQILANELLHKIEPKYLLQSALLEEVFNSSSKYPFQILKRIQPFPLDLKNPKIQTELCISLSIMDPEVKKEVIEMLRNIDFDLEAQLTLIKLLSYDEARNYAFSLLETTKAIHKDALISLTELLDDPNPVVRSDAAKLLKFHHIDFSSVMKDSFQLKKLTDFMSAGCQELSFQEFFGIESGNIKSTLIKVIQQ